MPGSLTRGRIRRVGVGLVGLGWLFFFVVWLVIFGWVRLLTCFYFFCWVVFFVWGLGCFCLVGWLVG